MLALICASKLRHCGPLQEPLELFAWGSERKKRLVSSALASFSVILKSI